MSGAGAAGRGLSTAPFATVRIEVGAPVDLGPAADGHRRMVPILGGTVAGPVLRGRVVPGGADHQVLHSATLTWLDAQYVLETEEGERVSVRNTGVRSGSAADIAAIVRGEPVPPERIYFRTVPRLSSSAPRLAWLAERVFVARAERHPDAVLLDVHLLD